ncbi:GNAT family N-acetyltransferase [Tsukamurella serpentis]
MSDYSTWRDARLDNREHLAPAFGSSERDWAAQSSPQAWVEWLGAMRDGARAGTALPSVVVEQREGAERVVGSMGICAVDPVTRSGEFFAWCIAEDPSVVPWAASNLVLRAFTGPLELERVVGPVAMVNPAPGRALHRMGWTRRAGRRALRVYDGAPADHDLWVLENDPAVRDALAAVAR